MMALFTLITKFATFMTSTLAIPLYGLLLGWAGVELATTKRWHAVGFALGGAAVTFCALWAISYFYGGGGGGTFA